MKRISIVFVALCVIFWIGGRADSSVTVTRYPIISGLDDASQRGCVNDDSYQQDVSGSLVVLQRGETCDLKLNGAFRFVTTIPAGTVVQAAFMQGFNDFGQSTTQNVYGDKTAGSPNFAATNPHLLVRARTSVSVQWNPGNLQNTHLYTPNLAAIINALDVLPGWNGTVTFLFLAGSNTDHQGIDIRTFESPTGPSAVLEVQT